jgi:hypothetical protein
MWAATLGRIRRFGPLKKCLGLGAQMHCVGLFQHSVRQKLIPRLIENDGRHVK